MTDVERISLFKEPAMPAASDVEARGVIDASAPLRDTPYDLGYITAPTPASVKFVFQHAQANSPSEAHAVIAAAMETLAAGKAEWADGTGYGRRPGDIVGERWAALYSPTS